MAEVLVGKHKGDTVTIHQFCNNWFSVENREKNYVHIYSPTALLFTEEEKQEILKSRDERNTGIMFGIFEFVDNRMKKIKRR